MRALSLFLVALLCGALHAEEVPRGIMNHNPGNLECRNLSRWGATGCDFSYAKFPTDRAGLKALRSNLKAYWRKHRICTIDAIVKRWTKDASDTTGELWNYESGISVKTGKRPDEKLDMTDPYQLEALGHAIVLEENGQDPYPEPLYQSVFHTRRRKP